MPLDPYSSIEICEALVRHVELSGNDVFEKAYVVNGEPASVVICLIGEDCKALQEELHKCLVKLGYEITSKHKT